MKQSIKEYVEVITLRKKSDIAKATGALLSGKLAVMKMGSIYGLFFNPQIPGLANTLNRLKMRVVSQSLSLLCSCEQAKAFADRERVNADFYNITPELCHKVLVRFPVNTSLDLPFPYNASNGTVQFYSLEATHPILCDFQRHLFTDGCPCLSGTSANIHGAPTIETLADAKRLAVLFNIEASFWGLENIEIVVIDVPAAHNCNQGSFPILGFDNPASIEVVRLMNKVGREATAQYLEPVIQMHNFASPLIFAV